MPAQSSLLTWQEKRDVERIQHRHRAQQAIRLFTGDGLSTTCSFLLRLDAFLTQQTEVSEVLCKPLHSNSPLPASVRLALRAWARQKLTFASFARSGS